jgi:hypothetical protein
LSASDIDVLLDRHAAMREDGRKRAIKDTVTYNLWENVLSPLRAEIHCVGIIRRRAEREGKHAKFAAYKAYDDLLHNLIDKLVSHQRLGSTPLMLAQKLVEAGKLPPEVKGTHWTEFVTPTKKQSITAMFGLIPDIAHGRVKQPFLVNITKEQYNAKRNALYEQLEKEIASLTSEQFIADTEGNKRVSLLLQERIFKLNKAKFDLSNIKGTPMLPNTWHGLIGESKHV